MSSRHCLCNNQNLYSNDGAKEKEIDEKKVK